MMADLDLSTLSDHDIMMNLYMTVIMALHVTAEDPAEVELSLNRMTDDDTTPDQVISLQALMVEVEQRLGIEITNVATEEGRLQ
jgi:hypothetical protein